VEDVPLEDDSSQADSMDTNELEMALKKWGDEEKNSRPPSAEELAAIPEASPEQSEARRSKRRAGVADEEVGMVAERQKVLRNEGTSVQNTPLFTVNESLVISNLNDIGISLENNEVSISDASKNIKELVASRVHEHAPPVLKEVVLEKEEKELLEEEELDKLFLKNICSEIMDEVMDMGSECDVILPSGHNRKKDSRKGKKFKRYTK
jgi:hypothetical protein